MITDFKTLRSSDSLDKAVALTLAGSQKDFPVADNGRIEGVLTQTDLMKALSQREIHPTVASVAQNNFVTVDPHEMLEAAFAKLQDCNCHTLPVLHNGELVGLVTMDNLGEYMRIQAVMKN
jgi:predicted transcriptional regulator